MPSNELINRFPAIHDMNKEQYYEVQTALTGLHKSNQYRMTAAYLYDVKTAPMNCGQSYVIHGTPSTWMHSRHFSDLVILILCCEGYPFNGGTVVHRDDGTLTIFTYL